MAEQGAPVARLTSAEAEQAWVEEHIAAGIAHTRLAWIEYAQPAVIYGRSSKARPEALARAREAGCSVVQRRSGGGAVLAGPWMPAFALLLPAASPLGRAGIVGTFDALGALCAAALGRLGVACREVDAEAIARHKERSAALGVDWVCFSGLSHGELLDAQDCKLVGLAQARGRWGTLVSAGVLLEPVPWPLLGWVHQGQAGWTPGHPVSSGAARQAAGLTGERLRSALMEELGVLVARNDVAG